MVQLGRVEEVLAQMPEGPGRADLGQRVHALRDALQKRDRLEQDERRRLGHDLRVPLNAIAGWTHILRLDAATPSTVRRAVEVFDRNVRVLTLLIERFT